MTGSLPRPDLPQLSALIYLAVPNLIFFVGWLQPLMALLLVMATMYLLATQAVSRASGTPPSAGILGILIIAGLSWAAFSGGSHFFHADHDWVVRDAVLGDLVRSHWPTVYSTASGDLYLLRSAIGYFLPAAAWGKLFGLTHLNLVVYGWTALGCILFMRLIFDGERSWKQLLPGLLVVIGFSGMDFPGLLLATQSFPIFPLRLEWWVPLSYPSLTGHLIWAPNHCIPSLICAALLIRHRHDDRLPGLMLAALTLSLIWSPFTLVGMLPLVFVVVGLSCQRAKIRNISRKQIGAVFLIGSVTSLFLLVDIQSLLQPDLASPAATNMAAGRIHWQTYALFVLMEFGILGLCLLKTTGRHQTLLIVALGVLLILPFLHFGPSNDLLIRASTPALVVLLYFSLRLFGLAGEHQTGPKTRMTSVVGLVLLIGMVTPGFELARALLMPAIPADYNRTFMATQQGKIAPHYLGRLPASISRWMLAPSVPQRWDAKAEAR